MQEPNMANIRPDEKTVTQSAEQTTRKVAEETRRAGRRMADVSERAARANAEIFEGNTQSAQQIWQSGSEFASLLASRSVDQLARTLGVTSEEADDVAQQSSRNLSAIVQSSAALTNGMRAVWTESFELMRREFERSLDQMDEFMRCRTPQELAAVQSDAVRRNLEGMIASTHRIAEISLQATDEASRKVSEAAERVARAA
jgi:hypothetical protein